MEENAAVVILAVDWLKLALDLVGAVIVALGATRAAVQIGRGIVTRGFSVDYSTVRLGFARSLSMALEFQLASDIVATAFDPSWEQIAILAAIATIRTVLNFTLQREIREEETAFRASREEQPPERAAVSAG